MSTKEAEVRACPKCGWVRGFAKTGVCGNCVERSQSIARYQLRLKDVKSLMDLRYMVVELKQEDLCLVTKRKGHPVGEFSEDQNPRKTHYIIYDGVSTGNCRYENLYKYLRIESL